MSICVLIHTFSESRKVISQVSHESRFGPDSKKHHGPCAKLPFTYAQKDPKRRGKQCHFHCFTTGMRKCLSNSRVHHLSWASSRSIMYTCRCKNPNFELLLLLTSIFSKYRPSSKPLFLIFTLALLFVGLPKPFGS